ncbi:two-component system OmpR family sensor kinase [Microbacterium proteolyticum]|uniref:histidine kinase n=1 Tax=Microbacterium proteolyticum TaxID=1572644 RepID=A0A7W5GF44_9MICO|nr:ATP-binding protein [Microbacterium proteolyticum]MBB3157510.1 two-component system OmpR family sensor kinase [Microbacterium proteolyticum]
MTRGRWTLRRTLVVGTSVLVALAFVAMSLATILALRSFALDRLDQQVREGLSFAVGRDGFGGSGDDDRPSRTDAGIPGPGGGDPGADAGVPGSDAGSPAPRIGTLQAVISSDGTVQISGYTRADGTFVTLSDEQIALLRSSVATDSVPTTVDLGADLGAFRVAAAEDDGLTIVAGSSQTDVTATTSALTVILVAVSAGTLLIAVLGLSLLVRRSLRPLDRVARVAQRVSTLSLSAGSVDIPDRVAAADTDPATEVGRVGSSLNELLGHVQSSLAARQHSEEQLRRFIADASHELRTPLASIRGYAQLSLGEDAPMTPTQARSFDRIESEAVRMASLVDDLLLLARLDAGQTLRRDEVELTLLAVDAVSDAQAADATHEWRLDVTDDLISVTGDENRLRQVVANLLRNAQTHTPPGTTVTLALAREGAEAVLRVADTGPGIDPGVAGRLFDRFARADDARNRDAGSTGLGLSIAQAITEAHGGSISVESVLGRTVFEVRLPA